MPNEEKNDSELDELAANFFKQIGIEDFVGTIEFAKDVEKDVKKREKKLPKIPETDDSSELKKSFTFLLYSLTSSKLSLVWHLMHTRCGGY